MKILKNLMFIQKILRRTFDWINSSFIWSFHMDNDTIFHILQCFRSGNEELMMAASNELMSFYSTPDSLPILSSLYLLTKDNFLKKSILIGIDKALTDKNLSDIDYEQLTILQDNLILMLTQETDAHLLSKIEEFFTPILKKFQKSWPSLDNYIFSNDLANVNVYFTIFNLYVIKTKKIEDCDEIIEFARPKLQYAFQNDTPLQGILSAFCFIATLSYKMVHPNFIWEFTDEFKSFFQKLCFNGVDHSLIKSFLTLLCYIEGGIESSQFTKRVCPIDDIIRYCLSPDSNYSDCIHLRIFINKSLTVSELEFETLMALITNLIQVSKKLYSMEIDVQTQQIDDYFPILKFIPISQRRECCFLHIQNLIQENTPASICTALSIYKGAIISGVFFDQNDLEFFIQCYNINHLGVKMVASSTLVDISEELSNDIEKNPSLLIGAFCQDLNYSLTLPIEIREQFVLSIFEVIQSILIFCVDFPDEVYDILLKCFLNYIQNGTQIEQFKALYNLMQIIQQSSIIALLPEISNLPFQLLLTNDPSLKEIAYKILEIYVKLYPKNTDVPGILEAILCEPDSECSIYASIIGYIAIEFGTNEQIKNIILSRIPLFLAKSQGNEIQNSNDVNWGNAISALFFIMSAYNEIKKSLFPQVINSIANLIQAKGTNDDNISSISKGIEIFSMNDQSLNFKPEVFNPIFIQIKARLCKELFVDDNLFELLELMTNFIKCSDIPEIDSFVYLAIRRFISLMKSDEKRDIKGIQATSNFMRTVFGNYNSEQMESMGKQLVGVVLDQLTANESSSVLEGHLILVLSSIALIHFKCFDGYIDKLLTFLISKFETSISNTAKNIAYFFKNLAQHNLFNKDKSVLLWNLLISRLSKPECITPTILILNDNIISALISIEKTINLLPIDDFYSLISPFLPCYTDTYELFDIYLSLLSFYPQMNNENKNNLIIVLISFISYEQSASFFNAAKDFERTDLLVLLISLIREKLDSIDNRESFINSTFPNNDQKVTFINSFNYLIGIVQHQEESQEKTN